MAYALGITNIDPIPHGLLFERFLNPERPSAPDIDIDFDDRRRGEMVRYAADKWGSDRVAQVITFGTIKTKAAIKDSARVHYGQPGFAIADRITKALPPPIMAKDISVSGITDPSHERYKEAAEVRALIDTDPDVRTIYETARGLEGLVRNAGVHACAVIMSSEPLIDAIPLWRRPQDGAIITGWDYPSCEAIGLLKMDFLGLRNLTIIGDAIANIKANRGIDLDLEASPLDDPAAYELLSRGDTLGVFQLDGGPMRDLLRRMQPTEFNDIVAVLALYRPGPMGMNAHNDYADRKNNRQPIKPIHPEFEEPLKEILAETYGLIVYQEQIMFIAQKVASYTMGKADALRKAMGKKKIEVLEAEYEGFYEGMTANGFSEAAVKALWDTILPFAGYAFNKSHAAGYGLVSYWTAYLKANYPAEYMAGLLTSVGDDKDKAAVYLADCRRLGITVLPPDVNESVHNFASVGTDIRFGLGAVRNVGANVVAVAHQEPYGEGQIHRLLRLPEQDRRGGLQQEGHRIADQGRRVRFAQARAQGFVPGARRRCRFGAGDQEGRGDRAVRPVRRGRRRRRRRPRCSPSRCPTTSGRTSTSSASNARCWVCTCPVTRSTASPICWPTRWTPRYRRSSTAMSPTTPRCRSAASWPGVTAGSTRTGCHGPQRNWKISPAGSRCCSSRRPTRCSGAEVADDTVVLIKGQVNARAMTGSRSSFRRWWFRTSPTPRADRPVAVSLPTRQCTMDKVTALKQVLARHPGHRTGASAVDQRGSHHHPGTRRGAAGHAVLGADGGPQGAARPRLPRRLAFFAAKSTLCSESPSTPLHFVDFEDASPAGQRGEHPRQPLLGMIFGNDPNDDPAHLLEHPYPARVLHILPTIRAVLISVVLDGHLEFLPPHVEVGHHATAFTHRDLRLGRRQPRVDQPQSGDALPGRCCAAVDKQ